MCRGATALVVLALSDCSSPEPSPTSWRDDPASGGAATVTDRGRESFTHLAPELDGATRDVALVGNAFFHAAWRVAPDASGRDGLGPTFNATSCAACHDRNGRGDAPVADRALQGVLVRLSVPGEGDHQAPRPEPSYGDQLNPGAIPGVPPEGEAVMTFRDEAFTFGDGTALALRRGDVQFRALAFGPMDPSVMTSPRLAPPTFGLGLLEAVPEADLVERADENDRDADGISGRAHRVWDPVSARMALGRFGWKATQPTVLHQCAGAFLGDLGVTTSLGTAQNCPTAQTACRDAPAGGAPELDDAGLRATAAYMRAIAVPARRDPRDAVVLRGAALFVDARCDRCHTPTLTTGDSDVAALSRQVIHPYSDLLLHDMGDALADGRPDHDASGREWRTPPLWGIGLAATVTPAGGFLHDGRARTALEAIAWHDGEATFSRDAVRAMPRGDRDALLRFLGSL